MKKNVQIPYELFIDLVYVHLLECDDADIRKRIERGLNAKVELMVAHELYTISLYRTIHCKTAHCGRRQRQIDFGRCVSPTAQPV